MTGLAAVIDRDGAAGLRQPPRDAEANNTRPDDNRLRVVRGNNNGCANRGLPSPGHARPGSVGLFSAAVCASMRRTAPQPHANFRPSLRTMQGFSAVCAAASSNR